MSPNPMRVAALLLAAAACRPPASVIQIAPGREPGRPSFTLPTSAVTLYGLAVVPCNGGDPRWQFGTGGGVMTRVPPAIVYGEMPAGFSLIAGPTPLTPGCYEVFASGASGRFTVRPGGLVVPDARSARDTTRAPLVPRR